LGAREEDKPKMKDQLTSIGYELMPSKYSPDLGFSGLRTIISGKPTQRYFDVKTLHLPTFDGRFFHQTQVTRHELAPIESLQVCPGQISLETYRGEKLHAFTFGGVLRGAIKEKDMYYELTSNAPVFRLQDDFGSMSNLLADEAMDLLAEKQVKFPGHENELYSRLAKFDPYQIFLATLVSLQVRVDSVPANLRRERYHKASSNIKHAIKIVRDTDGWDGKSPSLEDLLSN